MRLPSPFSADRKRHQDRRSRCRRRIERRYNGVSRETKRTSRRTCRKIFYRFGQNLFYSGRHRSELQKVRRDVKIRICRQKYYGTRLRSRRNKMFSASVLFFLGKAAVTPERNPIYLRRGSDGFPPKRPGRNIYGKRLSLSTRCPFLQKSCGALPSFGRLRF